MMSAREALSQWIARRSGSARQTAAPNATASLQPTLNTFLLKMLEGSIVDPVAFFSGLIEVWRKDRNARRSIVFWLIGSVSGCVVLGGVIRWLASVTEEKPQLTLVTPTEYYDVCIVGACPSGSAAGYYLSQAGKNVVLLEKERVRGRGVSRTGAMPLTPSAQRHLSTMGVLQDILNSQQGCWLNTGGFVSPCGNSFVGNSVERTPGRVLSIPRNIIHEQMALAATRSGVNLIEGCNVKRVSFSKESQLWEISCLQDDGIGGSQWITHRAKVLIAADGSESALARRLGTVLSPPRASVTLLRVKNTQHNFTPDGVAFFRKPLLPGYIAVFKSVETVHVGYYCPTAGQHNPADIVAFIKQDEMLTRALGPSVEFTAPVMEARRTGGVTRSYADNFIVVGGAAGHADPLTGMGTQFGLEAAKIAADTLIEAFAADDLSERFLARYQRRCTANFSWNFFWSKQIQKLMMRYPALIDALALVIQKEGGGDFLASWSMFMTGSKSKLWCLRPDVVWAVSVELLRMWFTQKFTSSASSSSSTNWIHSPRFGPSPSSSPRASPPPKET